MSALSSVSAAPMAASTSAYLKEVTVKNLMTDVINASSETPVLVYFTASWCGPCKQFGPTLEKVVNDAKGKLRLAKVDVDKSPELAQQFQIQSVPMVYIFVQGQPVDGFAGAMLESQLKQILTPFLEVGPEAELAKATLEEAKRLLDEGNGEAAAQHYETLIAENKDNLQAVGGLASAYIMLQQLDQAEALLSALDEVQAKHEAIVSARAALALAQSVPKTADLNALTARIAKNPLDHEARFDLAGSLFVSGKQEEAITELLAIIAKNKDWNEGAARVKLLTFFEALGHVHPLTMQGRRKLSSILF